MKRKFTTIVLALSLVLSITNVYAKETKQGTGFIITKNASAVSIYVDANDYEGVIRAVGDLHKDIKSVSDVLPEVVNNTSSSHQIIIGTIGKSKAIDSLIANGKLNVDNIKGKWECYSRQVVDGNLIIVGSDMRGTIYGIYDVSEEIGVSPWSWWADVTPAKKNVVTVASDGIVTKEPSVQYRGIFLNDEENLTSWAYANEGKKMGPETYKKVFELLLRLKANYLWPAMHESSDAFNTYEENAKNANSYGIIMGSSHCEMLLRNNVGEWKDYANQWQKEHPDRKLLMNHSYPKYDYTDVNGVANKELVLNYWEDRVKTNGAYGNMYTIGMRGEHDGAWSPSAAASTSEKVTLLSEIITEQRRILAKYVNADVAKVPQLFIPYKEILPLYNAGLEVPDEVTLMWPNDNFGYIRQLPTDAERKRAGGAGIYYHLSYYGSPTSYLWVQSTPLALVQEEMTKAYDRDVKKIWIANVGDIKPAESGMEYFLKLAFDVDKYRNMDTSTFLKQMAKRDFGEQVADEIGKIGKEYFKLTYQCRPEFMTQKTFSLYNYGDEGQQRVDAWDKLSKRAKIVYDALPADKKDAYYEMQLYAIEANYQTALKYIGAQRANEYLLQQRGLAVNKYSAISNQAYSKIIDDIKYYNEQLANGKWNLILNPYKDKLPKISQGLQPPVVSAVGIPMLNVVTEGQTDIGATQPISFSNYTRGIRFIDIYNSGDGSIAWTASADKGYIRFNKSQDTLYDDDRIHVSIDWDKAPQGDSTAQIKVNSVTGTQTIDVKISNKPRKEIDGYAEANGYVSIEAEHYTNKVDKGEYYWKVMKDLGRSGDSVKVFPNLTQAVSPSDIQTKSAVLEYKVYFENTGTFPMAIYRLPTLDELNKSVNYAVGIDDNVPTIVSGVYAATRSKNDSWAKNVLANSEKKVIPITVPSMGYHTIKLYNVDPAIVIDKMVIYTDGIEKESYYGAPESYNSIYNTQSGTLPEATKVLQPTNTTISK